MFDNTYSLEYDENITFAFDSVGPQGVIRKMVQYQRIESTDYYNLAFGDRIGNTNDIDDLVVSNNGDLQKILSTVAQTVITFTQQFPSASIVATGSTSARTRLYRIGISKHLLAIEESFEIFGFKEDNWHKFEMNTHYEVFLIKLKKYYENKRNE